MTVVEATEAVLRNMGFPQPGPVDGNGVPPIPEDPTLLSDEDISTLYFAYVGWLEYAESERWKAKTEYKTIDAKLSRLRARIIAGAQSGTVTDKKAGAATNPQVMDLEERLLAAEILLDRLTDVCQATERKKDAMSREMSRRGSKSSRSSRWQ